MKHRVLTGHLCAIFTVLVWGSSFVVTKHLLDTGLTAIQIIPLRMGLAYLTLLAMRPRRMHLPLRDELVFLLIGIAGGSLYFFLQNQALTCTYAANVSILVSISPILTALLTQLFVRGDEKPGRRVYLGSLASIAGVALVVLNGTLSLRLSPAGDLLALGAAAAWAVYSVLIRPYIDRCDNLLVTRRVFFWAFLTSVPLTLLTDGLPDLRPVLALPRAWLSLLFLAIFGNAVCFAVWNIAIRHLGVIASSSYLYTVPFVTAAVGWVALGEPISAMSVAGAVLITLGVILASRKPPDAAQTEN